MKKQDIISIAKEVKPFIDQSVWEEPDMLAFLDGFASKVIAAERARAKARKPSKAKADKPAIAPKVFEKLVDSEKSLLREKIFYGWDTMPSNMRVDSKVARAVTGLAPVTFKRRVRDGVIPKPHKIGRLNFWLVGELRQFIAGKNP